MHTNKTLSIEASSDPGDASGYPDAVTLDAQTITRSISNFCENTASVACLAQELAVRFAVLSGDLKPGDVIDADHLLARLSAAVVKAGWILEAALDLTVLGVIPTERFGTVN